MYLNILIFVLLFGLLQGILLVLVLLTQRKIHPFHILLGAYTAVMLLQVAFKVLDKMWLLKAMPQSYFLSYYLPFLYGPLIFLFFVGYLAKSFSWKWKYLLHFIPFIFFMLFYAFANPQSYPPSIVQFLSRPLPRLIFQLTSLVIYHVLAFRLIQNTYKRNDLNIVIKNRILFLKKFSAASIIITPAIAATLFFLYINFPNYQNERWLFALLPVFVYWLSYEGIKKPELFKVVYGAREVTDHFYKQPQLIAHRAPVKYANSSLKEDEVQRISTALLKSMDVDKIYLDADLNIEKLAAVLTCRKHHLSQVLNDKFHLSFNEFMNQKRIAQAKMLLSDKNFNHFKIASVAFESGFNSLSSFNDTFKKLEGITPSQYRVFVQHQNQSRIHRM
jgi:AraC-like DNA-binding protein